MNSSEDSNQTILYTGSKDLFRIKRFEKGVEIS